MLKNSINKNVIAENLNKRKADLWSTGSSVDVILKAVAKGRYSSGADILKVEGDTLNYYLHGKLVAWGNLRTGDVESDESYKDFSMPIKRKIHLFETAFPEAVRQGQEQHNNEQSQEVTNADLPEVGVTPELEDEEKNRKGKETDELPDIGIETTHLAKKIAQEDLTNDSFVSMYILKALRLLKNGEKEGTIRISLEQDGCKPSELDTVLEKAKQMWNPPTYHGPKTFAKKVANVTTFENEKVLLSQGKYSLVEADVNGKRSLVATDGIFTDFPLVTSKGTVIWDRPERFPSSFINSVQRWVDNKENKKEAQADNICLIDEVPEGSPAKEAFFDAQYYWNGQWSAMYMIGSSGCIARHLIPQLKQELKESIAIAEKASDKEFDEEAGTSEQQAEGFKAFLK